MNKEDSWNAYKKANEPLLKTALGEHAYKMFETIQKSGLLNRFGSGPVALQNFNTLMERFARKTHDYAYEQAERESMTKLIPTAREEDEK